jgi:hypothetical protein
LPCALRRYATDGLDQAMKAFFYAVESLLLQNNTELTMDNPQFQFIYQVG